MRVDNFSAAWKLIKLGAGPESIERRHIAVYARSNLLAGILDDSPLVYAAAARYGVNIESSPLSLEPGTDNLSCESWCQLVLESNVELFQVYEAEEVADCLPY